MCVGMRVCVYVGGGGGGGGGYEPHYEGIVCTCMCIPVTLHLELAEVARQWPGNYMACS